MFQKISGTLLQKLATHFFNRKKFSRAHRFFLKSASLGNIESQYSVGMNYFLGKGCLRSGSEALIWFERAALAGNTNAQFELGMALLNDRDESWCVGSAAPWVLNQAENNIPVQKDALFPGGLFIKKDEDKAFYWIKCAAEGGKPQAQANLGWLYMKGIGCKPDGDSAKSWFESAAVFEIPSAAFGLAELYSGFVDHSGSEELVFDWLEKAAKLGHVSAMYKLGRLYQTSSAASSRDKALHYLTLASNGNHAIASVSLAKLLLQNGDQDSVNTAEEKLRFASKAGSVEAPFLLGQLYYGRSSHYVDLKEAFSWFKVSADRGSPSAQFRVACMYAQGRGVTNDLSRAIQFFTKCAHVGHGLAAFNLGVFSETGEGVIQSHTEAVKWYTKASDAGVSEAKVRLARILLQKGPEYSERSSVVALLESAVLAGSADAELELARFLLASAAEGDIVPRVTQLLRSAAAKGSLDATALILSLVMKGLLLKDVVPFALDLFSEAALAGSMRAQLYLAEVYEKGSLVPKSHDLVEKWLILASKNCDTPSKAIRSIANFKLGVFYCKRNIYPDDIERGLDCYTLAGSEGHALAQYNLGIMYLNGIGVRYDAQLAVYWLSKFVEQGHDLDQSLLGRISALGYSGINPTSELPLIRA